MKKQIFYKRFQLQCTVNHLKLVCLNINMLFFGVVTYEYIYIYIYFCFLFQPLFVVFTNILTALIFFLKKKKLDKHWSNLIKFDQI